MSWWIIVLIIIAAYFVYDLTVGKKERNQRAEQEKEVFRRIRISQQAKKDEYISRLDSPDEHLAQRIKKLFYSAAYHESRNVTAFHNVLKELVQITKEILSNGGQKRINLIADRVEYLCGDDKAGFAELLSIMRRSYLEADATS